MEGAFYEVVGWSRRIVMREREREGDREEDREEKLSREEIRDVMNKIKEGKAAGIDGIPGEVWKHGGEEIEEWVWRYCNRIWKGEGWPQNWREGVIISIIKKGEGERVED